MKIEQITLKFTYKEPIIPNGVHSTSILRLHVKNLNPEWRAYHEGKKYILNKAYHEDAKLCNTFVVTHARSISDNGDVFLVLTAQQPRPHVRINLQRRAVQVGKKNSYILKPKDIEKLTLLNPFITTKLKEKLLKLFFHKNTMKWKHLTF